MKPLLFMGSLLLLATTSLAQNCAYTFTFAANAFAFCVSPYGTIGMIQSPIGTNQLNATTPVEGFEYIYVDESGGGGSIFQVPGIGSTDAGKPTFTQPNGAGKLPLIATWPAGFGLKETITANPMARQILITFTITDCGAGCSYSGNFVRVAGPELDGQTTANYAASGFAGIAYQNHGLLVESTGPCGGIVQGTISDLTNANCGGTPFTGTGGIFSQVFFATVPNHHATMKFTYQVF